MYPYRSKRLLYRAHEDTPTDNAFDLSNFHDPGVHNTATHALLKPLSTTEIKEIAKDLAKDNLLHVLICLIPESEDAEPKPIGSLTLKGEKAFFKQNRSHEFGIVISSQYQGHGYGPEAISWMLDWAFLSAGLHRVELTVYELNERARKVYEKLGFVHEGRRREAMWRDGRWWDLINMGMLEHEWRAKRETVRRL